MKKSVTNVTATKEEATLWLLQKLYYPQQNLFYLAELILGVLAPCLVKPPNFDKTLIPNAKSPLIFQTILKPSIMKYIPKKINEDYRC